ncbi:hypothetical protein RB2361 [Rhodopirellula baltica SH 1]|uniref:Uncharacterized protein n=1 Tax=Rhodopirellula baltica (strain DSM 10527 / NCIMB 13988 / SH1) TaxID=243090 RepID=Q7UVY9_RHOBA|nr:hypothetical protein RB2361 [Rhodopirellula baltica SH 1]
MPLGTIRITGCVNRRGCVWRTGCYRVSVYFNGLDAGFI